MTELLIPKEKKKVLTVCKNLFAYLRLTPVRHALRTPGAHDYSNYKCNLHAEECRFSYGHGRRLFDRWSLSSSSLGIGLLARENHSIEGDELTCYLKIFTWTPTPARCVGMLDS